MPHIMATAVVDRDAILKALEGGAAYNRVFFRGFGALRTESHLAQQLSTREKTHMMALYTQIPNKNWKGGEEM